MNQDFNFGLLPYQMKFLKSKSKFLWLCAGLGAGKSRVLATYCIVRMLTNPETTGLVCASTNAQLRDSILRELFMQLHEMGLAFHYSALDGFVTLLCTGARVKTFSLENFEVLRGIEVGWIAIDEACLAKEAAYNVALGRLRCKKSHAREVRIVSTPRGYDYLYDRYVGALWRPDHEFMHATALENFFLPDDYLPSLVSQYTPSMYRQEVLAEFISSAEGNVYYAFDRAHHDTVIPQVKHAPIYVGMDFNVNPMTAVLANMVSGDIQVFDEVYIKNSNTIAMGKAIKTRYPNDKIFICPDASGAARKTSSSQSDHEILRGLGFTIMVSRANPAVEDRYNTVNMRLIERRLKVSKTCKYTFRDLERVTHEDNPKDLTHISDALGYAAYQLAPLKRPRPAPTFNQN